MDEEKIDKLYQLLRISIIVNWCKLVNEIIFFLWFLYSDNTILNGEKLTN